MIQQGIQLDATRTRPVSTIEALNYQQQCNCCLVGNTGLLPMDPSKGQKDFLLSKADNERLGVITEEDAAAESNETIAERARRLTEDRLKRMRQSEAFQAVPLMIVLAIIVGLGAAIYFASRTETSTAVAATVTEAAAGAQTAVTGAAPLVNTPASMPMMSNNFFV
jgi:hypothetical protein